MCVCVCVFLSLFTVIMSNFYTCNRSFPHYYRLNLRPEWGQVSSIKMAGGSSKRARLWGPILEFARGSFASTFPRLSNETPPIQHWVVCKTSLRHPPELAVVLKVNHKTISRHLLSHFSCLRRPKVEVSRKTYFNCIEEGKSGKFETASLAKDY